MSTIFARAEFDWTLRVTGESQSRAVLGNVCIDLVTASFPTSEYRAVRRKTRTAVDGLATARWLLVGHFAEERIPPRFGRG